MSQQIPGIAGYRNEADVLAEQYEGVTFSEVHGDTIQLFPAQPSRVLDIGAGTGRDAAALAALGHRVVAVEPTPEMRGHGQRLHADQPIEWIDDHLPDLARLGGSDREFDLVLLTAVWMHLDRPERERAMASIAGLLAPDGIVIIILRHGPIPAGRHMFDVTAEETITLAESTGLRTVHRGSRPDLHGRRGVHMSTLGFRAVP
ncbi:class I SAM-dependent methyltransferase [Microtetraspora malaysiensis]|uniref:Class I SAM-dependent methyltransferase n=1 Tax=Microtetraspora malaysiensis TaxID=161358 RepID=A0ABW6SZG5_9ACTN